MIQPRGTSVLAQLAGMRIVPVIVIDDVAAARPLADALVAGGLRCAEVALRTPGAVDAITRFAGNADLLVGAGTVLDPDQVTAVVDAGARFVVCPPAGSLRRTSRPTWAPRSLNPDTRRKVHRHG
jgi:2-dehydro-3-deoxyphosphogluconate aldolase / (4S)-4-hydroxy-2-oxoglutarate aldolase